MSQQSKKPHQVAKDLWQTTTDALLSSDEVDAIYVRLGGLEVALDDDPLAYGPKRLQEKTSLCRKHLTECERIFLDVSRRLHKLKRELRAKKAALELSTKFLYAEDPEVRSGRNIADRDAFAAIKLKDEWMAVHTLTQQVEDMEAVMLVIKAKRSDLRDTQGRLRDQVRLCGQELELGGRWGTKRPDAPELRPGQVAHGGDVDDVLKLIDEMGGVSGEVHLGALDDDDEDDSEETPTEEPITGGFVNPDDTIDFGVFDDEDDEDTPASEPAPAPAPVVQETPKSSPGVTLNPEDTGKTAAEVLPGNGVGGDEIDRMLNSVSLPASTKTGGKSPIEDHDIDNLLELFE